MTSSPEKNKELELWRINAFFWEEKETHDISFKCFLEANSLSVRDSQAMHMKWLKRKQAFKSKQEDMPYKIPDGVL